MKPPRLLRSMLAVALTAGLASWANPGAAGPSSIPPGFDLFETDPQSTVFMFQGTTAIPPGFFDPGSDQFQGDVNFAGVPLGTFNNHQIGDTDTVVQRMQPANPMPNDTVQIELVALNLVSVEPITVTSNGGQNPQQWDVHTGLSQMQPSEGQMDLIQTGPNGGTFNAQLVVTPLFTFTRLSDGATRTLDASIIPQGQRTLVANNVPWRRGCILPALAVPGLNDGFCPSFTPEGQLGLTMFNANVVRHGSRPGQPMPEHFKCYLLERDRFQKRQVNLNDQFGIRKAGIKKRFELCNPARKNDEQLLNKPAHLVCYGTRSPDIQRLVAVRNQFGSQRLAVHKARRLCVPSQKREQGSRAKPIQVPIDHYQCYTVEERTPLRRLGPLGKARLKDQFGKEKVKIGRPFQLCAPVQKNTEPMQHPVNHLVCYVIRDAEVQVQVQIQNQFEKNDVVTRRPVALCVPSVKLVDPQ